MLNAKQLTENHKHSDRWASNFTEPMPIPEVMRMQRLLNEKKKIKNSSEENMILEIYNRIYTNKFKKTQEPHLNEKKIVSKLDSVRFEIICDVVCDVTKMLKTQIFFKSRTRSCSFPRKIIYFFTRWLTKYSLKEFH